MSDQGKQQKVSSRSGRPPTPNPSIDRTCPGKPGCRSSQTLGIPFDMDAQLRQRRTPFRVTTFHLGEHLRIIERAPFRRVEVEVDLRRVAAKPVRLREIPVRWLLAAAFFSLLAGLALTDGWASEEPGKVFGLLLLSGSALACWYNAWQLYRNILVYRDKATGQTAFFLMRASPSAEAVDAFVARIESRIEVALPPVGAGKAEVAAHHARMLNYLLEVGVLLPEEHSAILSRVQQSFARGAVVSLVPREFETGERNA